jgi:hypothetical protein
MNTHARCFPLLVFVALLSATGPVWSQIPGVEMPPEDGKLRIIALGRTRTIARFRPGGAARSGPGGGITCYSSR